MHESAVPQQTKLTTGRTESTEGVFGHSVAEIRRVTSDFVIPRDRESGILRLESPVFLSILQIDKT